MLDFSFSKINNSKNNKSNYFNIGNGSRSKANEINNIFSIYNNRDSNNNKTINKHNNSNTLFQNNNSNNNTWYEWIQLKSKYKEKLSFKYKILNILKLMNSLI